MKNTSSDRKAPKPGFNVNSKPSGGGRVGPGQVRAPSPTQVSKRKG